MADIFLSYSSEDKSKVRLIAFALEKRGWSVWWDRKITAGKMYDDVIEVELNSARCVVVIWTARSIASKWVKNEAAAGEQKNILVPLLLEDVKIPLAFSRIEAAKLIDWSGEEDNPELKVLMNAVAQTLGQEKIYPEVDQPDEILELIDEQQEKKKDELARSRISSIAMIAGGTVISLVCLYYFLAYRDHISTSVNQWLHYLVLIVLGLSVSILLTGIIRLFSHAKKMDSIGSLKYMGPAAGVILILSAAFYIPRSAADKIVTIRVFDLKKRPVTNGEVKLYLPGYIRRQSIDNVGQAQFTGIPSGSLNSNIKMEITSNGFENYSVDTTISAGEPMLISVTPVRIIHISGTIKNAAEMPLREVEINVDGTRYYAMSITDGSYMIVLKDYSPGDEITLTTSHKDFEDKTKSFRIDAADMKNIDFVLNPVK